ncbi:MAG: LacI family transcriptional regulator [Treponema sp.]|jgi:LacI family transcriptional regulator|nr:LacI family transcriptional regulator [Treponema sp.]
MKKQALVTLKDIAAALHLSVNTISCALKERNNISPETIRKVKEKALELGYIPNSVASSIRTGYTKTIAIILGDIANAYFSIMVKELERCLKREGYVAMILVTDEDPRIENEAIEAALSKNVDGIIIFPTCKTEQGINLIKKRRLPFILIGRRMQGTKMDYIISDDVNGGYLATKYLLDKGHRNILLFSGPDYVSSAFERKQGYLKGMSEAGIPVKDLIISCDITISEKIDKLIKSTLNRRKDFDAIFTYNDIIAFRIIRIARQAGYDIPDIIGYDNIQSKIDFGFDISSVNIYKSLMAEKATSWLLARIRHEIKPDEYLNEIVPVDLHIKA